MLTLQVISIFKKGGVEIRICLFPDPPGNKLFLISRGGVVLMPAFKQPYRKTRQKTWFRGQAMPLPA